ncbi:MAG: hypothetical protein ACKPKO_03980, partial [Candidatus Fonsibacter sp.]
MAAQEMEEAGHGGTLLGATLLAKDFVVLAKEAEAAEENGQRAKAAVARKVALAAKGHGDKGHGAKGHGDKGYGGEKGCAGGKGDRHY